MKVGFFGYGGNAYVVEKVRQPLNDLGIQLLTCHEHPDADVKWDVDTFFDFIDSVDIILITSRYELEPAKGVNRLAQAWSQKKPCVIYPMQGYLDYARDEHNCLIARNPDEAVSCITRLRDDNELRTKIADNGYSLARNYLHPHKLVDEFSDRLLELKLTGFRWKPHTFCQIIIPHYQPNLEYLELAVESALQSEGPRRDILVVSSSKVDPTQALAQYKPFVRVYWQPERLTFSQANNVGIQKADPKTTHFLLLNDDAILGSKALGKMFEEIGNKQIILNPYSNCDQGWLHNDVIEVQEGGKRLSLHPNMVLADVKEFVQSIKTFDNDGRFTGNELKNAPFCAFYATVIPKNIIDRVGMLNTSYLTGSEDLDYCHRAKRFGYECYWTTKAWVYHFGGKSRFISEQENAEKHHKEDRQNLELNIHRWGKKGDKKRVAFWTGPAWESSWDLDSWKTTGIGGSESVEGWLARAAAEAGHYVAMYGAHQRQNQYGVDLIPWNEFKPEEEYFDLFVASRNLNCVDTRLRAKNILGHAHDIFFLGGKEISKYHLERFTKFISLSPWHKDFLSDYHNLNKDRIEIFPNCVSVELFDDMTLDKKMEMVEWGRLHWSSSPDRGLDNLLFMLPWMLERCPDMKLHVWYGFNNWEASARQRNDTNALKQIENLKKQIEDLSSHVVYHGRVSQIDLAESWKKAWCLVYPTLFTETHYNSGVECMASYTVPIVSNVAALETTIGDYGVRVKEHPYSREGRVEFINKTVELYADKDKWVEASQRSRLGVVERDFRHTKIWEKYWSKYC
jgi:GT2 family glycosyltransferase